MGKSFSGLLKRFEKQKEVIEGYRTVGGAWRPSLAGLGLSPVWAQSWGPTMLAGHRHTQHPTPPPLPVPQTGTWPHLSLGPCQAPEQGSRKRPQQADRVPR